MEPLNRTFPSRIAWHSYLYLLLLAATTIALLWTKHAIAGGVLLVFLVILIERIIHTCYRIVGKEELVVSAGRFSKPRHIPLLTTRSIERIETFKIGSFHLTSYLLLIHDGGHAALTPVKEREFVEQLLKANPSIEVKSNE